MKKMKCEIMCRGQTFKKALGITALALLMLVVSQAQRRLHTLQMGIAIVSL